MREELDNRLCADFPHLFVRRHVADSRMNAGFCCGDGWYTLIHGLCRSLQHRIDHHGEPQLHVIQVKEKLGQLRFYVDCPEGEITNAQHAVIEMAELLSGATCEECGCPGRRVSNGGWLSVRCRLHEPEGSVSLEEAMAAKNERRAQRQAVWQDQAPWLLPEETKDDDA
ncbi:MAG TPA: hypothetical protein PLI96_09930 [Halothiobacillus sp.]|jgi:hypothetical protein|uniref:hypothetical protein n=1 Tax=Halothiobacillus sp. 15-55-196 TaxID=1970382 RepID=UPI0025B9CA7E|nr:hypothetical protein [Halothiobacillus sp. 15-55-196]HUN00781.1 hypothetical protein [Halothiobacillus sp.]